MRVMRIVDAVRVIREQDPGIGYYKLWLMMNRMFLCGWVPGRDSFLRATLYDELEPPLPKVQEPYPRLCSHPSEPALGQ